MLKKYQENFNKTFVKFDEKITEIRKRKVGVITEKF